MWIVAVLNSKGGAGKTTTAINLGVELSYRGYSVLMIDADTQGTLTRNLKKRPDFLMDLPNFLKTDPKSIAKHVTDLARHYDVTVVDGAPGAENMALNVAMIKMSNTILIPVQPTPNDVDGVQQMVDWALERLEMTGGLPKSVFVVKRATRGTILSRLVVPQLLEKGLPVLDTMLHDYEVYPQSDGNGMGVREFSPDSRATHETAAMVDELIEHGFLPHANTEQKAAS